MINSDIEKRETRDKQWNSDIRKGRDSCDKQLNSDIRKGGDSQSRKNIVEATTDYLYRLTNVLTELQISN